MLWLQFWGISSGPLNFQLSFLPYGISWHHQADRLILRRPCLKTKQNKDRVSLEELRKAAQSMFVWEDPIGCNWVTCPKLELRFPSAHTVLWQRLVGRQAVQSKHYFRSGEILINGRQSIYAQQGVLQTSVLTPNCDFPLYSHSVIKPLKEGNVVTWLL